VRRDADAIRLECVRKVYRRNGRSAEALAPLSLVVGPGEIAALVGPNGSGKTTALKIVATLVEPTGGHATVAGRDVVSEPRYVRRAIGVSLGTTRSFYWRLTARHNLAFFATLEAVPRRRIPLAIDSVADELGLGAYLSVPARRLSRGALARLSVARAMISGPRILVLDEPFASVDTDGRALLRRAFARRTARGGTVLLATHDPAEAACCDSVVRLDGGRRRP